MLYIHFPSESITWFILHKMKNVFLNPRTCEFFYHWANLTFFNYFAIIELVVDCNYVTVYLTVKINLSFDFTPPYTPIKYKKIKHIQILLN